MAIAKRRFLHVSAKDHALLTTISLPAIELPDGHPDSVAAVEWEAHCTLFPDNRLVVEFPARGLEAQIKTIATMILSGEMDADWRLVRKRNSRAASASIETSEPAAVAMNGSQSIDDLWQCFREAGATLRLLLRQAAASHFGCQLVDVRSESGWLEQRSTGQRITYGTIAEKAAVLPLPEFSPLLRQARTHNPRLSLANCDSGLTLDAAAQQFRGAC